MFQSIKQRLLRNEIVPTFAVARVIHPVVIEMFALAGGYRAFWIDQEHCQNTTEQLLVAALAGRARDLDCFVRIPPTGYWQVTQCLEAGASGVMAAQIHSAEQAAQFVSWTRFAPQGTRGLNTSGRDADYTHKSPALFASEANRDVFVAIQVETLGSLDDIDEIAALPEVDLLFVGPADLSLSLGVVGQFHHEKLWEAIGKVAAAAKSNGKSWGAVTPDPQFAERAIELGCRMPSMGNDVLILRRGVEAFKTAFSKSFVS